MSKVDKNEQINSIDLAADTDVLRAGDIIPSTSKEPSSQATTIPIKEIPQFDLAKQIMAGHRKVTSTRRKKPGRKTEVEKVQPQVKPGRYAIAQPMLSSEQNRIIAEIVAKDIESLCRGEVPAA